MIRNAAAVCLLFAVEAFAAQSPESVGDVLITGTEQPLRIRLSVTIDGQPWRLHFAETSRKYLAAVLARLDGDGDGKLSADEARRLPPPRTVSASAADNNVHVAFNYRVLDADDDGSITLAELADYTLAFSDGPVRMVSASGGRTTEDLFRALDANRDRLLTADEWTSASGLAAKDRDGNRVVTAEEIRGPMAGTMPPEFVAALGPNKILGPVGLSFQGASEGLADVEILVAEHGDPKQSASLRITVTPQGREKGIRLEGTAAEPVLLVEGRRIEWRWQPGLLRSLTSARQEILQEFEGLSERTEGHVTAATMMSPQLKSLFPVADRNSDSRLELAELESYMQEVLPLQLACDGSRMRLVQSGERPGLMPLVDRNLDGRLGLREMQSLPARLAAAAGESKQLTREGLPVTVLMVLQRGPFAEGDDAAAFLNAGPSWFFRADRNQDGDLDWEEFLGPREDFQRLDANEDGWIELAEALRAETVKSHP